MRIGVASSFTIEPVSNALQSALAATFPGAQVSTAPFNQIHQTADHPEQNFYGKVDTAVVLWRIEDLVPNALEKFAAGNADAQAVIVDAVRALVGAVAQLRTRHGIETIISIPPIPEFAAARVLPVSVGSQIVALHQAICHVVRQDAGANRLFLFDLSQSMSRFGIDAAIDWPKWYLYRQPFSPKFCTFLGGALAESLRLLRLPRKKCLVVDCDNTIWGGVVGEDGIGGIKLGEDFPGNVFCELQRQIVSLGRAGIFVALASKNNADDVWQVFEQHDGMVLSREDVAFAKINWNDKVQSIQEIAAAFNIGTDSVVFLDDSSFEVENVRSRMPEVKVLQVPEDIELLPRLLESSGLFDQWALSEEDRIRSASFVAEQQRQQQAVEAVSPESFRESLQLKLSVRTMAPVQMARVAQLINKTNQFNLTTRRRSESDVNVIANDVGASVLTATVSDKFGDYGLVGVAILNEDGDTCNLDTYLLSCRALGRGIEFAFMDEVIDEARRRGRHLLKAEFIPTQKNAVAASFLENYGFHPLGDNRFEIDLGTTRSRTSGIEMIRD